MRQNKTSRRFMLPEETQVINLPEFEIRYVQPELIKDELITSSLDAEKVFRTLFKPGEIGTQEQVIVLYLNRKNQIKGYYKHSKGGLDQSSVDVRPILAIALKTLSPGIMICHNHPSGNLAPSQGDINITRKLKETASTMNLQLLDHLILTENSYFSFADQGVLMGLEGINRVANNEIVLLDLFSGIGGFPKGLEEAGYRIKKHYFSEINKYSIANYKHNFKHATNLGEIEKIKGNKIERPDIVTFGSPCQDLSMAGKRKGLKGKRSGLFYEAVRLIKETKPRLFIFENVQGLLTSNTGKDFESVLKAFADIGLYDCQWQLLNTRWFLPQDRKRLYLVGSLREEARPEVFPIGTANALSPESDEKEKSQSEIVNTITSTIGVGGFHTPFIVYTDNSSNPNRPLYENSFRKLSPIECERLQGFSDNWTLHGNFNNELKDISDAQRYIMLGNAVSVPVVKAIGERLLGKTSLNEFNWLENQLEQLKTAV